MKKTLIRQISMLVVIMTILASCKKESPDYVRVIPVDASAVVGINSQSLSDKSGINDADKQKMIDLVKDEMSAATFKQVEKIIKDGSESGISTKDPFYFFTCKAIPEAIVMKVENIDKLNKFIELLVAEQIAEPATKVENINLVKISYNLICAYNESAMLFVSRNTEEKDIVRLMKQKDEESIIQSDYYKKMSAQKGDITYFLKVEALTDLYNKQLGMALFKFGDIELKDVGAVGSISFDKGKISFKVENMSTNEAFSKKMKEQQEIYAKINGKFLSLFPSSTFVYASVNLNGEKFYNALMDNEQIRQFIPIDIIESVKEAFNMFDGDISFGLTDFSMNGTPEFVAYAQAKNGDVLETLFQSKDDLNLGYGEDILKLGENEYTYQSKYITIYYGFKDKYIYATSNKALKDSKVTNSINDAEYASNLKGNYQYIVIDMKSILELPIVKMLAMMGGAKAEIYLNAASKFAYFEVIGTGDMKSESNLWMTDKDTNALKQLFDMIKQLSGL